MLKDSERPCGERMPPNVFNISGEEEERGVGGKSLRKEVILTYLGEAEGISVELELEHGFEVESESEK